MSAQISLPKFNDLHVHFRQASQLVVSNASYAYCDHVLAMPNTTPPIATGADARRYRAELLGSQLVEFDISKKVLLTIKLLPETSPDDIYAAKQAGVVAVKLYPRGATTNSADGISDLHALRRTLQAVQGCGLVLCLHGELPHHHPESTVLDWERDFITYWLGQIAGQFPKLRIVLEHISTKCGVEAVKLLGPQVAGTITPHHLLFTIDDVLAHGLQPRNYCMPVAKTPRDRDALRAVVMDHANRQFFLGSDSAPHAATKKYADCGCAGVFSAPHLPELVVHAFNVMYGGDDHKYLDELVGGDNPACCDNIVAEGALGRYVSYNGARFYGLPLTKERFSLEQQEWEVPSIVTSVSGHSYAPLLGGQRLQWRRPNFSMRSTQWEHPQTAGSSA